MAENNGDDRTSERRGVQRRTVVKGAAWSVPAIVIASQAPAMAASRPPVDITFGGSSLCKLPGSSTTNYCYDKGYVAWLKFTNTTGAPVKVKITELTIVGAASLCVVGTTQGSGGACPPGAATNCITVPTTSGSQVFWVGVFANSSTNSASTTVDVGYSWYPAGAPNCNGTAQGSAKPRGSLVGGSWTTDAGGGSCNFPPNPCLTPLSACGTPCAS